MKTRIDVISGFLGAGKTTLILKLLENPPPDCRIAVVENEYGEVGIDGDVLKDRGVEVAEVNAGCVCCTLSGNLIAGIKLLVARYRPDRILLEPTGLANLWEVLNILKDEDVLKLAEIGAAAAVLDSSVLLRIYEPYQRYFDAQIGSASAVFLNRTDGLDDEARLGVYELIRRINPRARVLAEPVSAEDAWQALNQPYDPPEQPWQGLPKAWLQSFKQVAVDTAWPGSRERLQEFLRPGQPFGAVIRAKGHVYDGEGARWRMDLSGGALSFEPAPQGGEDRVQLIGRNLPVNMVRRFFDEGREQA